MSQQSSRRQHSIHYRHEEQLSDGTATDLVDASFSNGPLTSNFHPVFPKRRIQETTDNEVSLPRGRHIGSHPKLDERIGDHVLFETSCRGLVSGFQ
jgi:hypothetical protein